MSQEVHADVPVSASISHAKTASVDEIIVEAEEIYAAAVKAELTDEEHGREELLKHLQELHPDFNSSFPLVLRWTVQTKQFRRAAMVRYLDYMKGREWKDRKEFLTDQGEYLVYLWREMKKKFSAKELNDYRKFVVDALLKEDEELEKMKKEAETEVKKIDEKIDQERRRKLYALLTGAKAATVEK